MIKFILTLLLLLCITGYGLLPSPLRSVLVKNAVDTALKYEGTKETKRNSSLIIDKFIRTGGGIPGYSWCMYYVYYCYEKASKYLKVKNPLMRTGSCSAQLKYANCLGSGILVIKTTGFGKIKARRGDIAIFKHGNFSERDIGRYWEGHTGINLKQIDNNNFLLIEGNTNKMGSREGDGVYQKIRNRNKPNFPIVAFLRC